MTRKTPMTSTAKAATGTITRFAVAMSVALQRAEHPVARCDHAEAGADQRDRHAHPERQDEQATERRSG